MTPREAVELVEKTHPGTYCTGNVFSYKNWYLIELSNEKNPKYIPLDSTLKIDKTTREISPYIPFLDGMVGPENRVRV